MISSKSMARVSPKDRGQIIIEYVLLLIVVVGIAAIIVKGVVSRSSDDPGFLIQAWDNMIKTIGNDTN